MSSHGADFLHHLQVSEDRFEAAEGARGMVMTVLTLPSYNVVFKVIKDRFDYPKDSSRREVMSKYRLVFEHDRAGRLVEAYEFEHLRIEQNREGKFLRRRIFFRIGFFFINADPAKRPIMKPSRCSFR